MMRDFFNLGASMQILIAQQAIAKAHHEEQLRRDNVARADEGRVRYFEELKSIAQAHANKTKWGEAEDAEIIETAKAKALPSVQGADN